MNKSGLILLALVFSLLVVRTKTCLNLTPPTGNHRLSERSGYFTFRIPSIIEAPNGDLIAFAEGRESLRDEGDIDLVMKRSTV